MPAAMADPITPPTLGPMAIISRKLDGLSLAPTVWHTRADMGTAETPAAPMRGLTFPPVALHMIFPMITPVAVPMENATRPRTII